jgi:hypothetical protein
MFSQINDQIAHRQLYSLDNRLYQWSASTISTVRYLLTLVTCSHCTASVRNDRVRSIGAMILTVKTEVVCIVCFHGFRAPSGSGPPHYRVFTITLRLTTLGRTPLDNWSAHRRETQQSKDTAIQCSRRDPNPQSQQASGRRPPPSTVQPLESAEKPNTWSTRRKTSPSIQEKLHMDCYGTEPRPPRWEAGYWSFSGDLAWKCVWRHWEKP